MMIDPAVEAAHTDDEIVELEERLDWLRRYRAICVGGPVTVEEWERRVSEVQRLNAREQPRTDGAFGRL